MDKKVETAGTLLQKKLELFQQYEQITDRLAEMNEPDEMEKQITVRDTLANSIDEIDREVKNLLQGFGNHAAALLHDRIHKQTLPQELQPLWEVCHQTMDTARRIRLKNNDLTKNFQMQRLENLERIKSTQNQPKISRYLNNLSGQTGGNDFGKV